MSDNLLITNCPQLIDEWDKEKNKDIDLNLITYKSGKKVWWICKNGHNFEASVCNRTRLISTGCKKCNVDKLRKIDIDIVNAKIQEHKLSTDNTKCMDIGDNNEFYIVQLLTNLNHFKSVKQIGFFGGKADIKIVTFSDEIFFIQVKTLTKDIYCIDYYRNRNDKKYKDNMLMVFVNTNHDRFVLDFYSKTKNISQFNFNSEMQSNMYKNITEFSNKLIELIPKSCSKNDLYIDIQNEYDSMERFMKFCEDKNLSFEERKTNKNAVDGIVNKNLFQTKFVNLPKGKNLTYRVNSNKSVGSIKKKKLKQPYDEDDFEFMIIEIGGTKEDKDKYKNQFCILPKKVLIEQGILTTKTKQGKKEFCICPPDYKKRHWSKSYWNDIKPLK